MGASRGLARRRQPSCQRSGGQRHRLRLASACDLQQALRPHWWTQPPPPRDAAAPDSTPSLPHSLGTRAGCKHDLCRLAAQACIGGHAHAAALAPFTQVLPTSHWAAACSSWKMWPWAAGWSGWARWGGEGGPSGWSQHAMLARAPHGHWVRVQGRARTGCAATARLLPLPAAATAAASPGASWLSPAVPPLLCARPLSGTWLEHTPREGPALRLCRLPGAGCA